MQNLKQRSMRSAYEREAASHLRTERALADAQHDIEVLRDVAAQAIAVIESVQTYDQPDDPDAENALTVCEHEVFDFDTQAARKAINKEPNL